ncbi:MAG TPA: MFS transporter [Candidatus Dormibacteraeota bacterium]
MAERRQPLLSGSYGAKVAVVLLALCPNIVITTGIGLMTPALVASLHGSQLGVELASGLSNAGYAAGAVAAVALNQKLPPRRLLLAYEVTFVIGSVLCALAPDMVWFGIGRVAQGAATGLLLVAALPPLVTRFRADKLPTTAAVINVGLFGAVTLGPILGGLAAGPSAWRTYFWILAALGALGLGLEWLAVDHRDPLNADRPTDWAALALAGLGTCLPFFGVSELVAQPLLSAPVLAPLVVGLASLVGLIVLEFHRAQPLMPVRLLHTTLPEAGILGAMAAGAIYVAIVELIQLSLTDVAHLSPVGTGFLFWPGLVGIGLAAVAFRQLFPTRYVPLLVLLGMLVLAGAALLLGLAGRHPDAVEIMTAAGALGFGAGAAVSPGLFLAGLSLPSAQIGTVFAMVELLRSEAAFLVGPVLLYLAMSEGSQGQALAGGVSVSVWLALGLALAATAAMVSLFLLGGARLERPQLRDWLESGEEPALDSPPTAQVLRD